MARTKNKDKGDAPPMAAMIDVVFLLLIFFIVTHKDELIEAHVRVNLPSPGTASEEKIEPKLIQIHVPADADFDGQYLFMGSTPMDADTVEETLAGIAILEADTPIIVKVSPDAQQDKLITLLDRCKKVGLDKLNVLTLK